MSCSLQRMSGLPCIEPGGDGLLHLLHLLVFLFCVVCDLLLQALEVVANALNFFENGGLGFPR